MLHYLLTKEGHTVVPAEDGERALAAAVDLDPDVAILDIGMPGLNGYELARELRPSGRPSSVSGGALGAWAGGRQSAGGSGGL